MLGPTHKSGGTLDLVMTSIYHTINNFEIIKDKLGSDHHPVFFGISCAPIENDNSIILEHRQYKKLDTEKFKSDLSKELFIVSSPELR